VFVLTGRPYPTRATEITPAGACGSTGRGGRVVCLLATATPAASHLTAVIITSTSAVVGCLGAGTGICTPRAQPTVLSEADLVNGDL
jgi:hypothetical protein